MSRRLYQKDTDVDYYKSLNKIVVLGLTGMATLGASMLVIESNRSEASPLKTAASLIAKNVLRLPAIKPLNQSPSNIKQLSILKNFSYSPRLSTGKLLSSLEKQKLSPSSTSNLTNPLISTKSPLIIKSTPNQSLTGVLKPKNSS